MGRMVRTVNGKQLSKCVRIILEGFINNHVTSLVFGTSHTHTYTHTHTHQFTVCASNKVYNERYNVRVFVDDVRHIAEHLLPSARGLMTANRGVVTEHI